MKHTDAILAELRRRDAAGLPAPTMRELARVAGIKSISTVHYQLLRMAGDGLVTLGDGQARSIRLTEAGRGRPSDEALLREVYGLMQGINAPIVEKLRVRLGIDN